MASKTAQLLAKHLRNLSAAARLDGLPDRELIERFVAGRDEDSFAALVRRHGPMVLRVCQRVLHNVHDAEDVFQAAFLVLSRKAASLRRADSVGCFLHGVAYRLALKARTQLAQQRMHESRAAVEKHADDPLAELSVREAQTILDEELARLPEKYRAPLVLCCLEGKTRDEAARQLGWSAKLVKSRLEQGRERLRYRLSRRGVTVPAALVATLLAEEAAPAALPAMLMRAVVQAAIAWPSNGVSASVALLAESALGGTATMKAKVVVGLLLMTSTLAAGVGVFLSPKPAAKPAETPAAAKAPEPAKSKKPQPPRVDCFGDPLPQGAMARLGTVRLRHGGEVRSVAFSPHRKTIASGGQDNTVRLWDLATGKEIRRFTAVTGVGSEIAWVSSIAFSPDGKFLAAGTMNGPGEVVVWELATGKEARPLHESRRGAACLNFSPDGKVLAAGTTDGLIHLWDAGTGKLLRRLKGHRGWIESIAFAPDSKMLASGCRDKTIRLWDVATGRELRQLKGHSKMVLAVAFAPDGTTLASGSWDNTIRYWDTTTGKELRVLEGHEGTVSTLAFLPDGKKLASGSWDGSIRLWDTDTGKEIRRMQGHQGPVTSVAVSPDGKTLASGSWDRTVRIWDVTTGQERRPTEGNQSGLRAVAIAPDGQRVATGGEEGVVRLWDASSGKELLQLIEPHVIPSPGGGGTLRMLSWDHLQFAADGKTVIVPTGHQLGRWNAENGKQIHRRRYSCEGLFPTPDGKFVTGFDGQENLCLLDAATGKKVRQFKTSQKVFVSAISTDGKFLASGSSKEDGTVVIREIATGKERCRCKGAPQVPSTLTFSPHGKYLAGTTANFRFHTEETPIYLWDAATGREVRRFRVRGHYVRCLTYSSDGRMLASGGSDKTVRLWETATGKERRRFAGHQGAVHSVALSVDGTRLVSASDDTTALVWDATPSTSAGNVTAKQLQAAWSDLAGDDAAKAYRAIWLLARHPRQSVPLLREHMPPARALDAQTRKQVERWLTDLDSDSAAVRERASTALEKSVVKAEPMLRKALTAKPSLEQRKRIEQLLERLEQERVTQGRALETLEHAKTPQARQLLEALAKGEAGSWLTRQAKAALARLTHRSSTTP